jgi:multiple sugar transport system permease protein
MAVAAGTVGSTKGGRRTMGMGWILATYILLVVFVLWTVIPFLWMFLASIKTNKEIYNPEFTIFPKQVFLGHYADLLNGPFLIWFRNSTIVSLTSTLLSLVLGSFGAYAITRLSFKGRKVIAVGLVGTYLLPASLLFIPLFQIIANLGMVDSIYGLMLVYPTFTLPFCTWLLMSYFRSIPAMASRSATASSAASSMYY